MAHWIRDERNYQFPQQGYGEPTFVSVTGVMDVTESERPKLFIEERGDNKGPSLYEGTTLARCISSLSASMNIEPQGADWYTRDRDGQLQSVSFGQERVTMENPQYTALLRSGDLSLTAEMDAKKYFPDVTVNELRTSEKPATLSEQRDLAQAFSAAQSSHQSEPSRQAEPESLPMQKSAHDYDLSKEQFPMH